MFSLDQGQIGCYHVQDLRAQARRDAEATIVARASGPRGTLRDRLRSTRRSS